MGVSKPHSDFATVTAGISNRWIPNLTAARDCIEQTPNVRYAIWNDRLTFGSRAENHFEAVQPLALRIAVQHVERRKRERPLRDQVQQTVSHREGGYESLRDRARIRLIVTPPQRLLT
jgi:hypothetical protein